jgi:biopolymer transport protein ExbB
MKDIFHQGGPLMYPILLCSIIGWAIFMERFFAYYKAKRQLRNLYDQIVHLLARNKIEEAYSLCQSRQSALARILQVVLKNPDRDRRHLKSVAEEVGEREAVLLQRYLGLLGTIANIAPLIGLLGTVLGMIEAFDVISHEGVGSPATLGGGISQALITTAAGLTVAVPMILVHRYLLSRSDRLVLDLEEATMHVIDRLEG